MIPKTLLTLFEDRRTKVTLTDTEFNDLLELKTILGAHNVTIEYDRSVIVRHFVGFVELEKIKVQILPKIMENSNLPDSHEMVVASMRALFSMLRYSEFSDLLDLDNNVELDVFSNDLLEIFIILFAQRVFRMFALSAYREYTSKSEQTPYIKGKIDIACSIREARSGIIDHTIIYDSFSENNLICNIIKTVLMYLYEKTAKSDTKRMISTTLVFFENSVWINLSEFTFKSVKYTRMNLKFKPIIDLSQMFFKRSNLAFEEGESKLFAFFIPVNRLFEYYVFKRLDNNPDFKVKFQSSLEFVKTTDGKSIMSLSPDFLVYQGDELMFIGDAKYKNAYSNDKLVISATDLQQVYTYAKLLDCKRVNLYYPCFLGNKNENIVIKTVQLESVKITINFVQLI